MQLIEDCTLARKSYNFAEEKRIGKEIKKLIVNNWAVWLDKFLKTGDWDEIRKLKRGVHHQQGRLQNESGQLISTEEKAETLAEHVEEVQ